jgi:hypothetical protein
MAPHEPVTDHRWLRALSELASLTSFALGGRLRGDLLA